MTTLASWNDVKPGDTLTVVRRRNVRRGFKMRVAEVRPTGASGRSDYRIVIGERLTMGGASSRLRGSVTRREELVHLDDITAIECGEAAKAIFLTEQERRYLAEWLCAQMTDEAESLLLKLED